MATNGNRSESIQIINHHLIVFRKCDAKPVQKEKRKLYRESYNALKGHLSLVTGDDLHSRFDVPALQERWPFINGSYSDPVRDRVLASLDEESKNTLVHN